MPVSPNPIWRSGALDAKVALIVSTLRNAYDYLNFTDEIARMFAADFVAHEEIFEDDIRLRTIDRAALRPVEEAITSQFLLATDFFQNDRDTDRQLQYLGYPDPYTRPGCNSLA